MRRKAMLPAAAVMVGLLNACAVPMLTSLQSSQYCEVDVQGPSGPPVLVQGTLLDPATEASVEVLANASLVGWIALVFVLRPLPVDLITKDPRPAIHAAHACDPGRVVGPSTWLDFVPVMRTADAQTLARALKATLDAPRSECASPRARRDPAAGPDGRVEIEAVSLVVGCLYGRMSYRIDARWTLKNAQTGGTVATTTTQCVLESSREVADWLDYPVEAHAEIEGALAATGRRVATELVVGYPPAAQCRLGADAAGTVSPR